MELTPTKCHYNSWIEFARGKGHQGRDVHPVLVTGFNMTTDFSVVAYPNEDGISSANNTPFPMFNPPLGDRVGQCEDHISGHLIGSNPDLHL